MSGTKRLAFLLCLATISVAGARAGGEVVQLHKGEAGEAASQSKIVRIIDFAEN